MENEREDNDLEKDESLDFSEVRDDSTPPVEDVVDETVSEDAEEEVKTAKKYGHLSKEEYKAKYGSLEGYKTPTEFNQFGEWYKEVKELRKQMDESLKYQRDQVAAATREARKAIEEQLKQAKEFGDIDSVEKLTEQRYEFDARQQQEQLRSVKAEQDAADAEFLENNRHWFNESRQDLVAEAKEYDQLISEVYPTISYREKLKRIEKKMRVDHPELFPNKIVRPQMSASQSGVNKSAAESTESYQEDKALSRLDPMDRAEFTALNDMLKRRGYPTYTLKEYVSKLKTESNRRG